MIDLFGMGRQEPQDPQNPAPEEASAPGTEAHPPKGSHRLWAFLLVLDSIFVIVFGGAVAAKVYQYWRTPAVAVSVPVHRHASPKSPEPAKAAEPAPAAPKAAETAKAEPAPKAEPKSARHAEAPRPPKPSMLVEAPKPHAAPSPASAAPAAPSGPVKAQPVVFKVHAPGAGSVQLVGAFIVHGGRKEMAKDGAGNWTVKLYLNPGQYRYFFAVDKKKTLDPENPRSDRGASLLTVP